MVRSLSLLGLWLIVALSTALPSFLVSAEDTAHEFDVRLELDIDPRETPPLEGEMVLATIRGFYRETITNEELKLRRMTDFDWIQLKPDFWTQERIDGLPTVVFERRIAIYPKRPGALTVLPIVHELEITKGSRRGQIGLVRSAPVTLQVDPKPAGAGSDWLPVTAIELSDTWSTDPAQLDDGQSVQRRVVLRALGVPPELLPKQPAMREHWLITFAPPEERSVQLTPQGPVSTAVWVWNLRPITGEPGVIPQVVIPYFDTADRVPKAMAIEASPIGYASFASNAIEGWQSGFAAGPKLWLGFALGVLIALMAGLSGRRFSSGPLHRLQAWFDRRRRLKQLGQLQRDGDTASFRGRMTEWLTSETALDEAERLKMTEPLDAEIFAGKQADGGGALAAAYKKLSG